MPLQHHSLPCQGYWNYGPLSERARGTSMYPWTQLALISNAMVDLRKQLELIDHYMRRYGLDKRKLEYMCPSVRTRVESGKYIGVIPLGTNVSPDDLKVSMKDHLITVEAKREEKSEDGNTRCYQEFTRKFTLPEKVEMKEVKSFLSPEGELHIEAPLPNTLSAEETKELESELTEGFVHVAAEKGEKKDGEEGGEEIEVPVNVSTEEKPSGCVNN